MTITAPPKLIDVLNVLIALEAAIARIILREVGGMTVDVVGEMTVEGRRGAMMRGAVVARIDVAAAAAVVVLVEREAVVVAAMTTTDQAMQTDVPSAQTDPAAESERRLRREVGGMGEGDESLSGGREVKPDEVGRDARASVGVAV
jgi:hypothetical protein